MFLYFCITRKHSVFPNSTPSLLCVTPPSMLLPSPIFLSFLVLELRVNVALSESQGWFQVLHTYTKAASFTVFGLVLQQNRKRCFLFSSSFIHSFIDLLYPLVLSSSPRWSAGAYPRNLNKTFICLWPSCCHFWATTFRSQFPNSVMSYPLAQMKVGLYNFNVWKCYYKFVWATIPQDNAPQSYPAAAMTWQRRWKQDTLLSWMILRSSAKWWVFTITL